jgi:hypothetical protein
MQEFTLVTFQEKKNPGSYNAFSFGTLYLNPTYPGVILFMNSSNNL